MSATMQQVKGLSFRAVHEGQKISLMVPDKKCGISPPTGGIFIIIINHAEVKTLSGSENLAWDFLRV